MEGILGSYKIITWLTFIILTFITGNICKLSYGSPCKSDSQCQSGVDDFFNRGSNTESFLNSYDVNTKCRNSRCVCGMFQVRVFKNHNYECVKSGGGMSFLVPDDAPTCEVNDNETCINGVCEEPLIDFTGNECKCNDGFLYDGVNCKEYVNVSFSEDCKSHESGPIPVCNYEEIIRCNSTGSGKCECYKNMIYHEESKRCLTYEEVKAKLEAYIAKYPEKFIVGLDETCGKTPEGLPQNCNETLNMSCQRSKCKCTRLFYPLKENKTCESKETFMEEHNLTSYQVMPGVYCYDDTDCITGLDCHNNLCDCPYPCKYNSTKSACDCGTVSALEGASPAILVGVIGGLVIVAFWGRLINNTMKKGKSKSRSYGEPVHIDEPSTSVPLNEPYRGPLTEPYRIKSTTTSFNPNPAPISNPASKTVPKVYPESASNDSPAPVGLCAPTAPPSDTTKPPFESTVKTPYSSYQAPGYPSDPISSPYPGTVPSDYPLNPYQAPGNTSDPTSSPYPGTVPSAYPYSGPSAPAATGQTGTDDPPPAYNDIYKPYIA